VNAETEEKMKNEQRIKLIKGAVNNVDINYNRFDIKNCKNNHKTHGKAMGIQIRQEND